jgi:hypothetical protein
MLFLFAGKLVMLIAQVLSVSCTVGTRMQVTSRFLACNNSVLYYTMLNSVYACAILFSITRIKIMCVNRVLVC